MAADFEKQSYWRDRFAAETSFEWLAPSATFMPFIEPHLLRRRGSSTGAPPRILHLGSGTSDLHAHFRMRGYRDLTNVDYEPLALERGREIEERAFGDVRMGYEVADVTRLCEDLDLGLGHETRFDVVVDKSTVDAVACGGEEQLRDMIAGVRACLAPDGIWISLSYSAGRFQLDGLPFDVEVIGKIPTPKTKVTDPDVYHWCYLLRPR
ncbi:S-adenosyl-L-methionine-dependent methyltransferase [Xylaria palmicola]|nr:S-adenosyl-L-methionine-dependent methyltransferase [Xylaria palmicola]